MRKKLFLFFVLILISTTIIYGSGKSKMKVYTHENPGFSFEYPKEFKSQPLQQPSEVIRIAAKNMYKLPVFIVHVYDKDSNFNQSSLTKKLIDRLKSKTPDSTDFQIHEEKNIKLNDGSDAYFFVMTWTWVSGTTSIPMETASVTTFSDDKEITMTGSVIAGQNLLDFLIAQCLTLKLLNN